MNECVCERACMCAHVCVCVVISTAKRRVKFYRIQQWHRKQYHKATSLLFTHFPLQSIVHSPIMISILWGIQCQPNYVYPLFGNCYKSQRHKSNQHGSSGAESLFYVLNSLVIFLPFFQRERERDALGIHAERTSMLDL